MLAPYTRYSTHAFLPAIPSPLSPRSANIVDASLHARAFFAQPPVYMSEAPSRSIGKVNAADWQLQHKDENKSAFSFTFIPNSTTGTSSDKPLPYAQRARTVKKAPLFKQDELRERRRENFFRKVREGREDGRFEARGEDVLRAEWMRERRAREEQLAGSAPELEGDVMVDEEEGMRLEAEAEEWAGWEDGELEALIDLAPGEDDEMSEHAWSDDEGWEEVWNDYLPAHVGAGDEGDRGQEQQPLHLQQHETTGLRLAPESEQNEAGEAMDVS